MKKIVSAVVILALAAGISSPYVSGMIAEKQFRALTEKCNEMFKEGTLGASMEIIRYDRGYTSSEVDWKYNLGALSSVYGVQEILVHETVKHGMTSVAAETSLMKNPQYAAFVKTKLGGKDPLHLSAQYSLTGNSQFTSSLDPFSLDTGGATLQVKPAHMVVNVDKSFKHFAYDGSWDGLAVDDQGGLEGVSVTGDLTMESVFLMNGFATMTAKKGWVKDEEMPLSFANLKVNCVTDLSKETNRFSSKMEYSADSLTVMGDKIDNGFVRLALNNVNASAYEELLHLYMDAINEAMRSASGDTDPRAFERALKRQMKMTAMQLLGPAEKMMTKGVELQVSDMHCTLPQGKVTGDFSLGLKKDMTLAQFMPLAKQPELALDIFSLQSHCSLPKVLLAGEPQLFQPMTFGMQTGLFVEKGEQAEHVAEIKDGKLLLNGQEVQL